MSNSLEDRLKAHSNAFDGLLSLIPAKYYYDEETSNQWQQKKKSKEELKSNKRMKLDPESSKDSTAKQVMNNIAKDAKPVVLPGQKKIQTPQPQTVEQGEDEEDSDESVGYGSEELSADEDDEEEEENKTKKDSKNDEDELIPSNVTMIFNDEGDALEDTIQQKKLQQERSKVENLKNGKTKKLKKELSAEEKKEREENLAKLRAKLSEKISTLKEKRKAPGTKVPGAATSRQQILEERRKKDELRKSQKELRKKRDIEEVDDNSSSEEENEDEDNKSKKFESNVMFSNIEFANGERATSDLSSTRKIGSKKGPSNNDIKAHLKKIEMEKAKLSLLDSVEKEKLDEKNKWNKALAKVQGLKMKDDEKLLKKALRRKESQKRKSEREWIERKQIVADTIKAKSDRREENLRIRRQNKGKDRKHQTKQLRTFKGIAKPKRAGFEGKFKSGKGGSNGSKGGSKGKKN
ncbi:hypothetical protein CANARDRAFT_26091 [[Candida] arabinofermentans NRRL YB-2248]|uniref:Ribosomal RNA-processing protein 14/surfeit locus protein 6 C-terminal domain-containing protein n=1 Tax=[Candida] arabinofermentans NRRL YB-2248 TaxID=983967 RepID=A0A1E4T838_9ASCO|nr:hypothetical protein CANARDRAFT_26091 [[Candida] arabinofermentans NRRL YB-2248]